MKNIAKMVEELKLQIDSLSDYMEEYKDEGMDTEDDEMESEKMAEEPDYPEEESPDEDSEDEAAPDEEEGGRGALNKKPIAAIVLALKKKKAKGK